MRFTIGNDSSDGLDAIDGDTLLEFADEAADHLETIEQDLLRYGRSLNGPTALNPTLRCLHSLKGSAGYVSLVDLQELCHQCEDILSRVVGRPSSEAQRRVDLVLDAIPAIRARLAEVRRCCNTGQRVPRANAGSEKSLADLKAAFGTAR
ncbi:MAG TPA: Hpt domain-containing protein [Polyangiaceae bacterium]|nr:Hpt domain-containing protein [Polyangiaceae bacterium]